jgi:hypothetical protein
VGQDVAGVDEKVVPGDQAGAGRGGAGGQEGIDESRDLVGRLDQAADGKIGDVEVAQSFEPVGGAAVAVEIVAEEEIVLQGRAGGGGGIDIAGG